MARLATLLTLRALARRTFRGRRRILGRRQRAVPRVHTQSALELLQPLALLGDLIKQRQYKLPRRLPTLKRNPLRVLPPKLHAP